MEMMTGQGILSALVAVVSLGAYVIGLHKTGRLRPLATVSLFCAAMALWQLGMAMLDGLRPHSQINVIFGSAFLILAAISQVAGSFRRRERGGVLARQALPTTGA